MRRRAVLDQRLDIGGIEPQVGERLEALPGGDRLRQEHAVEPARARPGDDVDEHAQADAGIVLDLLQ